MAAVAVAGLVLFAVRNRKFALTALLPLAIGATATALVVPTGDAYEQGGSTSSPSDSCAPTAPAGVRQPGARGVVARRDTQGPARVGTPVEHTGCRGARGHHHVLSSHLAEVAARHRADDDRGRRARWPRPPGPVRTDHAHRGVHQPTRLRGHPDFAVAIAAAYWLLDREPTVGPDGLALDDPEAVKLWKGLRALPRAEAEARVTAVHQAAQKCQDTTGPLTRSAR
ncbi:hypothetical protein NKH77_52860 [Streptomyces sp. M19]